MSILEIYNLTHSFKDNILYKDACFSLNKGEHIGVVGQNGAGKSTFINIITGQIIPDEGRILWQRGIKVGYLDQYAKIDENITIESFLKSAFKELYKAEEAMNELYRNASDGRLDVLEDAAKYQEILEINNFYNIDTRIKQISYGLGINAIGLERKLSEISGGQRAKVILSKLLLENPDVLLLDEPTNFLDKEHIQWLMEYLSESKNSFMVVSHDYDFLEKISNRICDIDNKNIKKYHGTYSQFLKKKTFLREDYIRKYNSQQREIKRTEEFIRRNIAGRKSRMAKGRRKQLERMDKIEALDEKEIKPSFCFKEANLISGEILNIKNLSVGYTYPIISGINLNIKGGQKIVLTGFNGIGKSTLLKTLVKEIPQIKGDFKFNEQIKIGYFSQDLKWQDPKLTPVDIVSQNYKSLSQKEIRRSLFRCGISSKHALQEISTLSGGEQTKVKLCLIIMKSCNFLIMDEPTNHMDVNAKEALKSALMNFKGSVLLVSHEEYFYKNWTDRIINMEDIIRKK